MNDAPHFLPNTRDAALRARARAVVPGGMWGHQNAANLPEGYPQFFSHAKGSRLWDVDGNEYVDFMCSWGPMILGYRHPAVEEAVARQLAVGDCMNGPGEAMVELAEAMVATVAHADWVQFQRNGTDATTFCVTLARSATGRRKILQAVGAYHGALPWSSPALAGATSEDRAHVIGYHYNDCASLRAAAELAGDDLAAIVVSAFKHDLATDQEMPTPDFANLARALCDAKGAALILDDVRAGFRLHPGGSWELVGVRPDLAAWSKAIANGHPLAAVTGNDRFREAATRTFSTGSFWTAAIPYAAGVATLKALADSDAIATMARMGTLLRDGLHELSVKAGLPLRQTGPVQMPMVLFEDDPGFAKANAFCSAALRAGAYFHPRHNMFLSAAHTEDDIAIALRAAGKGFAAAAVA
jgi:glutamate-1-semialdehyde 2,1-aminomutase